MTRMPTRPKRQSWIVELSRLRNTLRSQGLWLTILAGIDKVFRLLTGRTLVRFSRIEPMILLGGQPARHVLPQLALGGVTGIINMRAEYDYASEIGTVNVPGTQQLRYLYLPTADNTAPSLDDLKRGVEFIDGELNQGGSVYIHCWEGLGRAPTMVAAYLVAHGASPQDAWEKIRTWRPFIRPVQVQMEQLMKFAENLKIAPVVTIQPTAAAPFDPSAVPLVEVKQGEVPLPEKPGQPTTTTADNIKEAISNVTNSATNAANVVTTTAGSVGSAAAQVASTAAAAMRNVIPTPPGQPIQPPTTPPSPIPQNPPMPQPIPTPPPTQVPPQVPPPIPDPQGPGTPTPTPPQPPTPIPDPGIPQPDVPRPEVPQPIDPPTQEPS